ncbi:MAG: hypothetical protein HQK50_15885 [Oligoflexia bacterium]|nr:hypothetical protein [Oligoflexia bacterium]MBF0367055.1 hypothetical protein [Oligoflexia bacterium]
MNLLRTQVKTKTMLRGPSLLLIATLMIPCLFSFSAKAIDPVSCDQPGTSLKQCLTSLQRTINALVVENTVLTNRLNDKVPSLPNIWKNSKFNVLADSTGTPSTTNNLKDWVPYTYGGAIVTYEPVSKYTSGFVGIYDEKTSPSYYDRADTVHLATGKNPFWYGRWNTGSRISREGWHNSSFDILKLHVSAGLNAGRINQSTSKTIHSPISKYVFSMYVKFLKGDSFGVSQDVLNNAATITRTECDKSPQGWCLFKGEFYGSSSDNVYLGFGKPLGDTSELEVLVALPYIYSNGALWAAHPGE